MMEKITGNKMAIGLSIALVILFVWAISTRNQLIEENDQLQNEVDYTETRLLDYQDALTEANDNIEQANSNIEDAQGYAWSTYQEMGDALDYLETVDTISEP